jgi:hypothetical protein
MPRLRGGVTFGIPVLYVSGLGSGFQMAKWHLLIFKIGIFNTAKFAHFFIASMKNADFLIVKNVKK